MQNNKILEKFINDTDFIFEPSEIRNKDNCAGHVLWILHGLDTNGAVLVSIEMIQVMLNLNYAIYVISPEDGPYRDHLLTLGVPVIIRPYVGCDKQYRQNLQNAFTYVFVSSAICYHYIFFFLNTDTKVFWWIHESRQHLDALTEMPDFRLLSDNIQLLAVTPMVKLAIQKKFHVESTLLHIAVKDCYSPQQHNPLNKISFLIPATYTYIKGQDILMEAISKLPKDYKARSEFIFCGYQLDGQEKYFSLLSHYASSLSNVTLLPELSKSQVYEKYKETDCVIAPSRIDMVPATIVEGMMFHKLCICSSAAGISQYMTDCVNGFIFESENADELYKRLLFIIEEYSDLTPLIQKGHEIYKQYFSYHVAQKRLSELLIESSAI